jgi:hypothetical protein
MTAAFFSSRKKLAAFCQAKSTPHYFSIKPAAAVSRPAFFPFIRP